MCDVCSTVYDASTKIPSGLVTGNIQQLGNYDQCLSIEVRDGDMLAFRGQQCRATIQFTVGRTAAVTPRHLDMRDLFYSVAEAAVGDPNQSPAYLNN
jgi:hypothetical protein